MGDSDLFEPVLSPILDALLKRREAWPEWKIVKLFGVAELIKMRQLTALRGVRRRKSPETLLEADLREERQRRKREQWARDDRELKERQRAAQKYRDREFGLWLVMNASRPDSCTGLYEDEFRWVRRLPHVVGLAMGADGDPVPSTPNPEPLSETETEFRERLGYMPEGWRDREVAQLFVEQHAEEAIESWLDSLSLPVNPPSNLPWDKATWLYRGHGTPLPE